MTKEDLQKVFVDSRNRAVRARKKIEDKYRWKACNDAYWGAQNWQLKRDQPEWKAALVSPKSFEIVERLVPVMTDSRPKPQVGPEEQQDSQVAQLLTRALDREYEAESMETLAPPVLRDVLRIGTGFFHTGVEPGYGVDDDLYTRRVPPWAVYASEGATSDRQPNAIWIHNRMTEAEIWCYYPPEIAKEIIAAGPSKGSGLFLNEEQYYDQPNVQTVDSPVTMDAGTTSQVAAGQGSFEVHDREAPGSKGIDSDQKWDFWEGYLKDPQTKMVDVPLEGEFGPEVDEAGEPVTKKVPVPVYPNLRFVVLVGDTYIEALDRPNPFPHKGCPLIPIRCYDQGDYYGMSFLHRLLDTDEAINRITNQLINCVALTLNPVIVADDDSEVNFEAFSPYPGVVVTKRWDRVIEFKPPPGLPPYVFQLLQDLERLLNDASGISDISRGNFAGGLDDVSGAAVQRLQDPTYTRIRAIMRNYEKAITEWMRQQAANMIVFRPASWFERTLGPYIDPMTGAPAPYPWESWSEADLVQLPDIKMSVGSSLPIDKRERMNTAINIYDRAGYGQPGSPPAVDKLLKAADDPDREQIVREVEQQWAQQQALAQAQAMAQQQAEGGEKPGDAPPGGNKATGMGASPEEERYQQNGAGAPDMQPLGV